MRDLHLEYLIQDTLDSDNRVWVIGDIHGYVETLKSLMNLNWGRKIL